VRPPARVQFGIEPIESVLHELPSVSSKIGVSAADNAWTPSMEARLFNHAAQSGRTAASASMDERGELALLQGAAHSGQNA